MARKFAAGELTKYKLNSQKEPVHFGFVKKLLFNC